VNADETEIVTELVLEKVAQTGRQRCPGVRGG